MMDATARLVVCLCLGWTVCQVRGSYIPVEMNRTIQNLLQHYVSTVRAVVTQALVFPPVAFTHTDALTTNTHTGTCTHTFSFFKFCIHYK